LQKKWLRLKNDKKFLLAILRDIASEHPEVRDVNYAKTFCTLLKKDEVITIVHDVQ
jgi:hypothetical protein